MPVPTRELYDFAGWYLTQNFSDETITGWNAGEKTGNITLYTKWAVTVKAENVVNIIEKLLGGTHNICVVGDIDETTLIRIGAALRSNENVRLNLDLSKTTGLVKLSKRAFIDCTSLTSIELPESVTSIEGCSFYWCKNLTSIKLSKSITGIGISTFYGCTSLKSIELSENITTIEDYAFRDCTSLINIKLPESITSIGELAFAECTSLTNIEILLGVEKIDSRMFLRCTSLTDIKVPKSVTYISEYVFYECTNLTSIEISSSVTTIGEDVFYGCTNLTTVNFLGTIEQWKKIDINEKGNDFLHSAKIICTDGIINE